MAFTESATIFIPEVEIKQKKASHKYEPLRGHGHVMAVMDKDSNECLGYILSSTLGYKDVQEFVKNRKEKKT